MPQTSGTESVLVRRWVERRPIVLAASSALFVLIFAVRQPGTSTQDALALLYVLPVALIALELGARFGLAAAALALGLVVVWDGTRDVGLGTLGLVTRGVVFASVGIVAGVFSDRMREVQDRQHRLLEAGLQLTNLADAARLPASLASHAVRVAGADGARVVMTDGAWMEVGLQGPSTWRTEIPGRDGRLGTLEVHFKPERRLPADARAALAVLALQGAVAEENQRLLEAERERAAIRAELGRARNQLGEKHEQLARILAGQERERRHVSHELHEQATQMLAAVLVGIRAIERDLGSDTDQARLATLRSQVDSTLRDLRSLAVALRPPVLDDLGLAPALEQLARDTGAGTVKVEASVNGRLPREVETAVYRIAQDALATLGAGCGIRVSDGTGERVSLELHCHEDSVVGADVAALVRARVELLGGTVTIDRAGHFLLAEIPFVRRAPAAA